MTITYHAGRRIQGLSTDFVETLTFEDDFTTDKGWTSSNTTYLDYDSANQRLKTAWYGTGNIQMTYDLGAGNVSDTAWILRMKINLSASGGADNEGFIGVSSADYTVPRTTAQDFIGLCFLHDYSGRSQNGFYNASVDNAVIPPTNNNQLQYDTADNTDYWLELKRTSATSFTYTLYSDSAFSNVLGTKTVTIASTISSLRYIKFANYNGAATNLPNAYVDDIKFYNGVSSLTSKPTNVQSGSRFEETDTRKIYYGAFPVTYETDFSSSTGWQLTNDTISGGTYNGLFARSSDRRGYYDLSSVSDSAWILRYKLTINSLSLPDVYSSTGGIWIGDQIGDAASTSTDKALGLNMQYGNSGYNQQGIYAKTSGDPENNNAANSQFSTTLSTTTRYYEYVRDGSTFTVNIYSDSAYSTLVESKSVTGLTGFTGLRYLNITNYYLGGSGGGINFSLDDLKFYNGVTSTDFTWTEEV